MRLSTLKLWSREIDHSDKHERGYKLSVFGYLPSVTLYAVEALEVQPPTGQEPIHWRLLRQPHCEARSH
ncbi:hypothetical protein I8751_21485 [Nostocaceae cyanobacterium CENA357]|uniref:Uncharacterized protein n=1 Tax=Atlanticothrix silvestris CENA357 TaxID=1725252 RepID=A0A8J7HHN2_9CYAN|nr:hypothetical protein [Atlanticothrix silvestris]MBH8554878.1 hypothetical protein [Atlanticothrix silvestris CENA357]